MKKGSILALLLLFCLSSFARRSEVDSLFAVLDRELAAADTYVEQRERQIAECKEAFRLPNLMPAQQYNINAKLYDLYYPFKPDSAIVYIRRNIRLAKDLRRKNWIAESRLKLTSAYTIKSMYIDALETIKSVRKEELNRELLQRYYDTYIHLLSLYPHNGNDRVEERLRLYRDALERTTERGSDEWLDRQADRLMAEGCYAEARDIYLRRFRDIDEGTHRQAMTAHSIGHTYRMEGNHDMQKKYFAIAAIADVRNGIKENAALRALAVACYETDDIRRAYRYIYRSMEDAMFAAVNFRMVEVSQILPIIERSYQQEVQQQRRRLSRLTLGVGILSLLLIIAMYYVVRQMRKLDKTRRALSEANGQLKQLNESLKKSYAETSRANDTIRRVNRELSEANLLKETYISQFLTTCSVYIRKLENYQNSLNKKALENRTGELFKMLKSRDMIENELKELYHLFDSIFLDLYPDFIGAYNALMPEEERFKPKNNELLNTELRIFALIRLGISDSSQIAEFLHYSLATIYNYRTRVRNKALIPSDKFEQAIMQIGSIDGRQPSAGN